jgi:hypothetical protein
LRSGLSAGSNELRAGHGVRVEGCVYGEAKTRASLGVGGGEGHTLGLKSTATGDSKLVTSNVVLSTTGRSSSVESDSFSPQQVVTGGNVGRNLEVKLSTYNSSALDQGSYERTLTVVVQVLGSPEVSVTLAGTRSLGPTVLVDLEELARSISTGGVLDLAHVGKDRSPVSTTNAFRSATTVIVLVHLDGHSVSSLEGALSRGLGGVNVAFSPD